MPLNIFGKIISDINVENFKIAECRNITGQLSYFHYGRNCIKRAVSLCSYKIVNTEKAAELFDQYQFLCLGI